MRSKTLITLAVLVVAIQLCEGFPAISSKSKEAEKSQSKKLKDSQLEQAEWADVDEYGTETVQGFEDEKRKKNEEVEDWQDIVHQAITSKDGSGYISSSRKKSKTVKSDDSSKVNVINSNKKYGKSSKIGKQKKQKNLEAEEGAKAKQKIAIEQAPGKICYEYVDDYCDDEEYEECEE